MEYLEIGDAKTITDQPQRLHVGKQLEERVGMDKTQVQEMADAKAREFEIIAPPMELEKSKRELRASMAAEEDRKRACRVAGVDPCPAWTAPDKSPAKKKVQQKLSRIMRFIKGPRR